jgi:hypothetical protein
MHSPFVIPLAAFALTALIVAITQLVAIRDKEMEVARRIQLEELEHQRRLRELEQELVRVKQAK